MRSTRLHKVVERWNDAEDAEHAFPGDWIAQCELAERAACEDEPPSTHDYFANRARFDLWLGVYLREDVPKEHTFKLNAVRRLRCETTNTNCGALLTDANGVERSALDVYVIVRCAEVRRLLRRPR